MRLDTRTRTALRSCGPCSRRALCAECRSVRCGISGWVREDGGKGGSADAHTLVKKAIMASVPLRKVLRLRQMQVGV